MINSNIKSIAVALSSGGRTLQNLLEQQTAPGSNYRISCVISSKKECGGNLIAKEHDLPLFIADFRAKSQEDTTPKLHQWLIEQGPDLVLLAGFLAHFPLNHPLKDRIINIHPSLLPKHGGKGMYGIHVHRSVVAAGDRQSGATVHRVTEKYDEGKVLGQVRVPVKTEDADALAAAVFQAECDLYPRVLNKICGETPLDLDHFKPVDYDFAIYSDSSQKAKL